MKGSNDKHYTGDLGESILSGKLSDRFLEMLADHMKPERDKQIRRWSGVEHDDMLSVQTWREVIVHSLDKTFEVMEKTDLTKINHWVTMHDGIIEALTLLASCLQSRTRLVAKEIRDRESVYEEPDEDVTQTMEDWLARGCPL